ncbi:MAG: flavin reductase family protein [Roseovarius sp.]|nr:flavin reductase family protein [Roseovarius sp.]
MLQETRPLVERDRFIDAMRRVAATVTVVTTDGPAGRLGATVSAPLIDGATGFFCEVQQCVTSGSHLIVIGTVHDVLDGEARPLAWREGGYHRVVPTDCAALAAE